MFLASSASADEPDAEPNSDEAYQRLSNCKENGECTFVGAFGGFFYGPCEAGTDADCSASTACRGALRCVASRGHCVTAQAASAVCAGSHLGLYRWCADLGLRS